MNSVLKLALHVRTLAGGRQEPGILHRIDLENQSRPIVTRFVGTQPAPDAAKIMNTRPSKPSRLAAPQRRSACHAAASVLKFLPRRQSTIALAGAVLLVVGSHTSSAAKNKTDLSKFNGTYEGPTKITTPAGGDYEGTSRFVFRAKGDGRVGIARRRIELPFFPADQTVFRQKFTFRKNGRAEINPLYPVNLGDPVVVRSKFRAKKRKIRIVRSIGVLDTDIRITISVRIRGRRKELKCVSVYYAPGSPIPYVETYEGTSVKRTAN